MMDKSFGNHASILGERAGLKMKKRIIPVIVALALILIVALVGFGGMILDKYTYSKELADLDQYFGVAQGELAIVLQDGMVEEKALLREDTVYFDIDTMKKYLNEGFYVDAAEQKLLYTTAQDTVATAFGAMPLRTMMPW